MNIPTSKTAALLRVPWIWLLLPGIGGYVAARELSLNEPTAFFIFATILFAFAFLSSDRKNSFNRIWELCFAAGSFCLSTAHYAHTEGLRKPELRQLSMPPRELTLEVAINRVFEQLEKSDEFSGLGLITAAPVIRKDLVGKRIHFRLWQSEQSPLPIEGEVILANAVLYPLDGRKDDSFQKHLRDRDVYYQFRRGSLIGIKKRAGTFRRFCHKANRRIEFWLKHGAEAEDSNSANISVAMLLGKKAAIPPDQKERFILAGAMHLFAISGLHVAIIAGLLTFMLRALPGPSWLETILLLSILFVYVNITGAAPSAVRAFVMIAFWKASGLAGRRGAAFPALVASAVFVLALEPGQLRQKGFQLSYAVVASIILFGGPLGEKLTALFRPWPFLTNEELSVPKKLGVQASSWFGGALSISIAASLASAPLTAEAFGVFSPGGILLNVFLVLLAVLVLWLAVFSLPFASQGIYFFNEIVWALISCMDWLVHSFVSIPGLFFKAESKTDWAPELTVVIYLAICLITARRLPEASWKAFSAAPACTMFFIAFGVNLSLGK